MALPVRKEISRFDYRQTCTQTGITCYAYSRRVWLPCERCNFSSEHGVAKKPGNKCISCMHETSKETCKCSKSLYWWAEEWAARKMRLECESHALAEDVLPPWPPIREPVIAQPPPDQQHLTLSLRDWPASASWEHDGKETMWQAHSTQTTWQPPQLLDSIAREGVKSAGLQCQPLQAASLAGQRGTACGVDSGLIYLLRPSQCS